MSKLKILLGLIYLYLILLLVHFYMLIFHWHAYPMFTSSDLIFGGWLPYINVGSTIIYFISFSLLASGIFTIIRKGYFNKKAFKSFRVSGWTLLIIGVLHLLKDILSSLHENPFNNLNSMISIILTISIIFLGLGILFLGDILKNGLQLKSENDLTI